MVAVVTIGALRQIAEGWAIAGIVALNLVIGVTQERRAKSAIQSLEA